MGRVLAEIMPNAELMVFADGEEMFHSTPDIVARVRDFVLS